MGGKFEKEYLLRVAKVIDNDFIGSEDSFTCDKTNGYYLLTTNKCDGASIIRAYPNGKSLAVITRLGPDTDGYVEIMQATYERVSEIVNDQ